MPLDIYKHPEYYDIGFGWNPQKELRFLEDCFSRYSRIPVRRVLELGCGTGRLLIGLAKRGYETLGVEIRPAMIEYALSQSKSLGFDLKLVQADMADFKLENKVDAAFCAIDTFRYLLEEEPALSHLKCVGRALTPGGIYIIDLTLVGSGNAKGEPEEWTIERDETSVTVTHQFVGLPDLQKRRTIERTVFTVKRRGVVQEIETEDPMRSYTRGQFESLVEASSMFAIVAWHGPDFDIERPITPGPRAERVIAVLRGKSLPQAI